MRIRLIITALAAGLLLCSCGPTAQVLYYWGGESDGVTEYERLAYRSSDKQSPESVCAMLVMYEKLVSNPGGYRQVPPPGICAEYGWLLVQPETAAAYEEHASASQRRLLGSSKQFRERGRKLFEMEMNYYPESVVFLGPLAKKLFR